MAAYGLQFISIVALICFVGIIIYLLNKRLRGAPPVAEHETAYKGE
jgi:cbb3-type cytochrome oxidase subunit 3